MALIATNTNVHIFSETSEKIQIDDGDSSHLDIHQEDHDDLDDIDDLDNLDYLDDLDDLDEQLYQGSRILMILMILMSGWFKDQGS